MYGKNEGRKNWIAIKTSAGYWIGFNHFTPEISKARIEAERDAESFKVLYNTNVRRFRGFNNTLPVEFEIIKVRRDIINASYVYTVLS